MKQYLLKLFESTGDLSLETILLRLAVSGLLAFAIHLSYRISHAGGIYSRKFNVSLSALVMVTTTVMITIGNNISLSLGMVGALSIVRFRTAVKDSRDTVYIFWAIVAGITCGAGDFKVAAIGSASIFLVLLLFGAIRNDNRVLMIIRTLRVNESKVEAVIFQRFRNRATLRVKNTTEESIEFIYELSRKVLEKDKEKNDKSISGQIYEIGNVSYFNTVMQNDEIGS